MPTNLIRAQTNVIQDQTNLFQAIEKIHLAHFKFFPQIIGQSIFKHNGLTMIKCGLGSSMFNLVYGAPCYSNAYPQASNDAQPSIDAQSLTDAQASTNSQTSTNANELCQDYHYPQSAHAGAEKTIMDVLEYFNDQPFIWWLPKNLQSTKFKEILLTYVFVATMQPVGMICDLAELPRQVLIKNTPLRIYQVQDKLRLNDFINILEPYDTAFRDFYEKIPISQFNTQPISNLNAQEKLFVGYINHTPVVVGSLFQEKAISGIFNVLTSESLRNQGYGTDMCKYLLALSSMNKCTHTVLSSSNQEASSIYTRLGFQDQGTFECFESINLW